MSNNGKQSQEKRLKRSPAGGRDDLVGAGIIAAATTMFVILAAGTLRASLSSMFGGVRAEFTELNSALILNIAILLFAWRTHHSLNAELRQQRADGEEAKRLAAIDPLTGCLNRRSIGSAADELLKRLHSRGEVLACVMIDLDNFKMINDFNGHQTGDRILIKTAERISACAPQGALISRLGGDEFVCFMPCEGRSSERLGQFAEAVISAAAEPIEIDGESLIEITVSLGIATSDQVRPRGEAISDAQSLMHLADMAMYRAKKSGRNRSAWFEAPMEHELRFRSELESNIRRGMANDEFEPYYEQQIDLETGELVGFEMLARWNSPTLGLVSPDVFIPIAEQLGAIGEMSERLIEKALGDAKTWDPALTLAVNISPIQLRDPWFAQKLLKLLFEAGFPPSRLEIEITESSLHEHLGAVKAMMVSLKNQGIRISLDDFGTGYASLSQLKTLPFDRIKIDRSFVSNLSENADSATIVQAIASLGAGLGLPVTAEGVESVEVLAELRRLGNFKGQGFLYGRPETADQTRERLQARSLAAEPKSEPPADSFKQSA